MTRQLVYHFGRPSQGVSHGRDTPPQGYTGQQLSYPNHAFERNIIGILNFDNDAKYSYNSGHTRAKFGIFAIGTLCIESPLLFCLPSQAPRMSSHEQSTPNLLDHISHHGRPPTGAPVWAKLVILLCVSAAIGGAVFASRTVASVGEAFSVFQNSNKGIFQQIQEIVNPPDKPLRGEAEDRINILLLGIGGEGHDGALLADTIMVASYKPSTKKAALFSIPRDFLAEIPGGYGFRKINNAYAFAELEEKGTGLGVMSSVVETIVGQPIHYAIRVDFGGFETFIDDLGGIDLTVDQAFTDYEYPTENYGYQTVSFAEGLQHFDGATALKYVRSRHGNNGEGSDFARSRRQQKVIMATKEKAMSTKTLLNPAKIADAIATLGKHVETNIEPWELMRMMSFGKDIAFDEIATKVLDTSPEGLLMRVTGADNAYLVGPRSGDYDEIQAAFDAIVEEPPAAVTEAARVEIQNGTTIAGLASRTGETLEAKGFTITLTKNAANRAVTTTVIYDLTNGVKAASFAELKELLHAEVSADLSAIQTEAANADTQAGTNTETAGSDFVVIVGSDQQL